MKKNISLLICLLYTVFYFNIAFSQTKEPVWDNTKDKHWGDGFTLAKILSSADGTMQNAWFHRSSKTTPQPLIISLHTWSGDYSQEDPLTKEILLRDWNYIHPDFRGANNKSEACGSSLVMSDLLDAIRFAIKNARVDTTNVHIIGVSGGGYLTLLAYMQLNYPVKSFNAWAPISDLPNWYWESKGRHSKYATDVEQVAEKNAVMNWDELKKRSPMYLPFPAAKRKNAFLNIYEGVHDGYTGSVPITQSLLFYNKMARALYPGRKEVIIPDSICMSLVTKQCNPHADTSNKIGDRVIHLQKKLSKLSLTLFEGGHEMLVPQALSLIPINGKVANNNIISSTIADTNIVLPPAWAFGVLYGSYTNQQQTINRIKEIEKHNYPIDAYWIDSWFWSYANEGKGPKKYIDFVADTVSYPDRKSMWKFMQANHIKGGFWIWDCILKNGNEEAFNEFKQNGFFSGIYSNTNTWHNGIAGTYMAAENNNWQGNQCGNIDFDNSEAVDFFKQKMKHFFDEGADFIKLDRTSKISVCKTMFELSQQFGKETKGRGFLLSHTGGMETEEYKKYPGKWTDDTRSDWNVEKPTINFDPWVPKVALKENIAMYTDPAKSYSKIPFLTNDLGGFDMGKTDKPDEELYIRWLQFSMFCPITEVFSQPENPTSNLAWNYSTQADSLFRFYSHLRMQLFPYIYSYAHLTRIKGEPMIRKIPRQLYEYILGDELLVAPVYEKGAVSRSVYLPEGKWINYWTGEILNGNSTQTVAAPLEQIPLFVKEGSIIPMRNYASSIEKGNNKLLTLNIYPGSDGGFELIEDDGTSNDYLEAGYASTLIQTANDNGNFFINIRPAKGSYTGMLNERSWKFNIHCSAKPKIVMLNNQSLKFSYDEKKKLLILETSALPVKRSLEFKVIFD
jgi:pimeloyl-ACP methyl ester carboxylesterase